MIYDSDGNVYESALHHELDHPEVPGKPSESAPITSMSPTLDVWNDNKEGWTANPGESKGFEDDLPPLTMHNEFGEFSGSYKPTNKADMDKFLKDSNDPEKPTITAWDAVMGQDAIPRYKGTPGELSSEPSKNIEDRRKDTRPNFGDFDQWRDIDTDRWVKDVVENPAVTKGSYARGKAWDDVVEASQGDMSRSLGSHLDIQQARLDIQLKAAMKERDQAKMELEEFKSNSNKKKDPILMTKPKQK
jgi:hypothetical protein